MTQLVIALDPLRRSVDRLIHERYEDTLFDDHLLPELLAELSDITTLYYLIGDKRQLKASLVKALLAEWEDTYAGLSLIDELRFDRMWQHHQMWLPHTQVLQLLRSDGTTRLALSPTLTGDPSWPASANSPLTPLFHSRRMRQAYSRRHFNRSR